MKKKSNIINMTIDNILKIEQDNGIEEKGDTEENGNVRKIILLNNEWDARQKYKIYGLTKDT